MAFFMSRKSASLQIGGPSGTRYMFSKEGQPTEVRDEADIVNFRSRRDAVMETDPNGVSVIPNPPAGGTISPADLGMAASYKKFGSTEKTLAPPDPRVMGEAKPEEEKVVRRSSAPAPDPAPEPEPATEPEPESEPEPEKEPETEPEKADYESMSKTELSEAAKGRGIKVSGMNKPALIEALREADENAGGEAGGE